MKIFLRKKFYGSFSYLFISWTNKKTPVNFFAGVFVYKVEILSIFVFLAFFVSFQEFCLNICWNLSVFCVFHCESTTS